MSHDYDTEIAQAAASGDVPKLAALCIALSKENAILRANAEAMDRTRAKTRNRTQKYREASRSVTERHKTSGSPSPIPLSPRPTPHTPIPLTPFPSASPAAAAYAVFRQAATNGEAFDAMVRTVVEAPTGGQRYSWEVVGQAFVELQSTHEGQKVGAAQIRGWCKRIAKDAEPPPSPAARAQPFSKHEHSISKLHASLHRKIGVPDGQSPSSHPSPALLPGAVSDP